MMPPIRATRQTENLTAELCEDDDPRLRSCTALSSSALNNDAAC